MEKKDQLSDLPIVILHDILSRLPQKYVTRTSVLSKAWAETCSTFPILFFSDAKIIGKKRNNNVLSEDYLGKRKKFIDYVERALRMFHNKGLAIKKFKLKAKCFDLRDLSKDVDLWLKLACEARVEKMELCQCFFKLGIKNQCYILPTGVLEAKSLTKLVLIGKIRIDLAFMNRSIKFFSLQTLSLEDVLLGDEHAFSYFISCCPLIEYITLKWCYVLNPGGKWYLHDDSRYSLMKSLSMCGLPRLKGVVVQGIQEVYVDSPCLENLCYRPILAQCQIGFNRPRNLRRLSLHCTSITNDWLLELFSKCPFLENLKLNICRTLKSINISSVQLKVLELSECVALEEINVSAPNLVSCVYVGHVAKSIFFSRCSSQLKVNVWIHISGLDFREFIQNIKPQTVLETVYLHMHPPIADALIPVTLQVSSHPPKYRTLAPMPWIKR